MAFKRLFERAAGSHMNPLTMKPRTQTDPTTSSIPEGTPPRILLLEDDMELSQTLGEFLSREGYEVHRVPNGAEGIKALRSRDFHVIVCDMLMPCFPGDMFYRAVQQTCPEACDRFIFMTGHRADRRISQFIRRVRGLMLWKPFEMKELVQAIHLALQRVQASLTEPIATVST